MCAHSRRRAIELGGRWLTPYPHMLPVPALASSYHTPYHHTFTSHPAVKAWLKSRLSADLPCCLQLSPHGVWCEPSCSSATFSLDKNLLMCILYLLLDHKQVKGIEISDESLHSSHFQVQQMPDKCFLDRKCHFPKTIISNKGIAIKTTVLFDLLDCNDQQAFRS